MGDVVFAPLYEVLKRRGVRFEFFHRLENVRLASRRRRRANAVRRGARVRRPGAGRRRRRVPAAGRRRAACRAGRRAPDFAQLVDGERLQREGLGASSRTGTAASAGTQTLAVGDDFDFVVLGVSIGAIPHVCARARRARRALARHGRAREDGRDAGVPALDARRTCARSAGTIRRHALRLRRAVRHLGRHDAPVAARELAAPPRAIAYFCSVLPEPAEPPERATAGLPGTAARARCASNAVRFLEPRRRPPVAEAVAATASFAGTLLADAARRAASAARRDERVRIAVLDRERESDRPLRRCRFRAAAPIVSRRWTAPTTT